MGQFPASTPSVPSGSHMAGNSYTWHDQGAHDSSGIRRADGNQYGCTAEQRATMRELGLDLETAPKTQGMGAGKNEWEDALIKHKVMDAPLDHKKMAFMLEMKHEDEATMKQHALANQGKDADLEDNDLDDKIFAQYRESRMAELMEQQRKEKFGELYSVSQVEYVKEVTEASKGPGETPVFVHLYQDYIPECKLLNECWRELARRHKHIKFVKIRATDANAEYPDSALPTQLVYRMGVVVDRAVAFKTHGGDPFTPDGLEWLYAQKGWCQTELEQDPFERLTMHRLAKKHNKSLRHRVGYDSESDSD